MSESFEISSSTGAYRVQVETGALDAFFAPSNDRIIICDAFFADKFQKAGVAHIALEADERQKSLEAMPAVIGKLRAMRAARSTRFVAVGGGIVQDVAAFCASVYMRGVPWTYAPTTLLGMVDSCIGGKSSINVGEYKNLVGTFYPPQEVVVDPAVTSTLGEDQWAAGLCEAAKITYCHSAEAFETYLGSVARVRRDPAALAGMISHSLRCKKWFIETDEFDRGERLLLNFGHTFGHGLESASNFDISHGLAVGVGILAAIRFGEAMGASYVGQPIVGQLETHMREILAGPATLNGFLKRIEGAKVITSIESDKKHSPTHFTFVTIREDGRTELRKVEKTAESRSRIVGAIDQAVASLVA